MELRFKNYLNILLWLICRKKQNQNQQQTKSQVANSKLNLINFKIHPQVYVLWFAWLCLDLGFSSQDEFEIDNRFHCIFHKILWHCGFQTKWVLIYSWPIPELQMRTADISLVSETVNYQLTEQLLKPMKGAASGPLAITPFASD